MTNKIFTAIPCLKSREPDTYFILQNYFGVLEFINTKFIGITVLLNPKLVFSKILLVQGN